MAAEDHVRRSARLLLSHGARNGLGRGHLRGPAWVRGRRRNGPLSLHSVNDKCPGDRITPEILDAVRHHHEYLDGSGYPDALSGESIKDVVRILTIADIFAALIEHRPYKPTMPRMEAYNILCGMTGKLEKALVTSFKDIALTR